MRPRCLLLGASGGIGRALAFELARADFDLVLSGRDSKALETLRSELDGFGVEVEVAPLDLLERSKIAPWIEVLTRDRPLDALIFATGVSQVTLPKELRAERTRELFEVNFFALVELVEALLPGWIARGKGTLVGVSALCAYRGIPLGAEYAASKAAMKNYLESLALDLAPYGIDVHLWLPGFVRTAMTELNRVYQPGMVEPEVAARDFVRGLQGGRFRVESGKRTAWLMGLARLLPDSLYQQVLGELSRTRTRAEAVLEALPTFQSSPSNPFRRDPYGRFWDEAGELRLQIAYDQVDVFELPRDDLRPGVEALVDAYRGYSWTYPVTAFLAMTLVWRGKLAPLVNFYRQALLGADPEAVVLDVATGDGSLTQRALRGISTPPKMLLVDLSPDMIQGARRRLRGGAAKAYFRGDVQDLPLPPGSFRTIACFGGYHVFPDVPGALGALARLLHPEGTLVGSILLRPSHDFGRRWADRFLEWGHLSNSWTQAKVEASFEAAGLRWTRTEANGDMLLFEAQHRVAR